MGFTDNRRFPDFSVLDPTGRHFSQLIDLVVISHFHLDHCGALPYFTEQCGYTGPILMTEPTKDISPLLLEDFRKIVAERKGNDAIFTSEMIHSCISKVSTIEIEEERIIETKNGSLIRVKPFYAGHVLGAAMFLVSVDGESVLYTGDFNTTADRHLGAAKVSFNLKPDLLITESTYATTIRPTSKRYREQDLLRIIHGCLNKGGKVLIPTFALGRAQELCMLVDGYWNRTSELAGKVPVYMSAGLAEKATQIYQKHLKWTNEATNKAAILDSINPFDFKNILPWEKHYLDAPGPMVLFSTPGMLHSGQSLEVFRWWADDPKNLLIIPGYCVAGTVGAKVLAGHTSITLDLPIPKIINVKCQVKNLSFSAHADSKGIFQLIKQCQPRSVLLVHGEAAKMTLLKKQIIDRCMIPCFDPANGSLIKIPTSKESKAIESPIFPWVKDQIRKVIYEAAQIVSKLEIISFEEKIDLLNASIKAQSHPQPPQYLAEEHLDPSIFYSLQYRLDPNSVDPRNFLSLIQIDLIKALHPYLSVKLEKDSISVVDFLYINLIEDGLLVEVQWKSHLQALLQSVLKALQKYIFPE
jgi:integrator complex subunit 11